MYENLVRKWKTNKSVVRENFKLKNIMKLLKISSILIIILQLTSCKGHDEKGVSYPKQKKRNTEKFDIEKFDQCANMPNKPYSEDCKEILPDKSEIVQLMMAENYQEEIIPPPPSMIKRVRTFYLNTGVIKEELSTYIGLHFPVGEIKYYDQKGNLVKTEDTDLAYKDFSVKLLDLFEILQKEPLLDGLSMEEKENFNRIFEIRKESKDVSLEDVFKEFKQNKFLNSMDEKDRRSLIGIDFNETKKEWKVVKDLYPFGLINIKVDANDARVLENKYEAEKRP